MLRDLRFAVRGLRQGPTQSLAMILALASCMGLAAAIFGLVEAVLLRPFSFPRLDQVVALYETVPAAGPEQYPASVANFLDWQHSATSFAAVAAYRRWTAVLTTGSGSEAVAAYNLSPNFFSLTQVDPLMGTTFSERTELDDSRIVVSYRFWKNRLGGTPDVIGRTLTLDRRPYVVVAVMPASFDFPIAADAWTPLTFTPVEQMDRRDRQVGVLARLKPTVGVDRAQQEMSMIATRLAQEHPTADALRSVQVVPLRQAVDPYANKFLMILMIAVLVLLLLACANAATLQLAKAAMRRKELATKIALGASRQHVIAAIVADNLAFSSVAAVLGIAVAYAALTIIKASVTGAVVRNVAGLMNAGISPRLLWCEVGLAVLSALLVALPNIFQTGDVKLTDVLNSDGRGSRGSVRGRLRAVLVGSQIALATFLLIAAAMLVSSFRDLARAPLGYDPRNLVVYRPAFSAGADREPSRLLQFYREATARIRELPGTTAASVVDALPSLGDSQATNLFRDGEIDWNRPFPAETRIVGPDFFRTFAIRVIEGREFGEADNLEGQPVAIVSNVAARRLWPGQSPLGRRVIAGRADSSPVVVGVVDDVNHFLLEHDARPTIYRPIAQVPTRSMYVVFRARGPVDSAVTQARAVLSSIDHDRVYRIDTLEGILADISGGVRVVAALLVVVGTIALILAFSGIYAVLSYLIAAQSREIAIRMSLGATGARVVTTFMGYLLQLMIPGLALGVVSGLAFGRLLSGVASAIELTPGVVVAIVVVVSCASVAATLVPARRIARIDPAAVGRAT